MCQLRWGARGQARGFEIPPHPYQGKREAPAHSLPLALPLPVSGPTLWALFGFFLGTDADPIGGPDKQGRRRDRPSSAEPVGARRGADAWMGLGACPARGYIYLGGRAKAEAINPVATTFEDDQVKRAWLALAQLLESGVDSVHSQLYTELNAEAALHGRRLFQNHADWRKMVVYVYTRCNSNYARSYYLPH